MLDNWPNRLTMLRLILIPVFIVVFSLPFDWAAAAATAVFFTASFTDWLDGYLARKLDQSTPFGAFMDPVADKLTVATALILILQREADPGLVLSLAAVVIIGREITVSALREWMAELGKRAHVAVSMVGKFKTAAQLWALIFLIYREDIGAFPSFEVGIALLYISAALTLWSMLVYLRAAWPSLKE